MNLVHFVYKIISYFIAIFYSIFINYIYQSSTWHSKKNLWIYYEKQQFFIPFLLFCTPSLKAFILVISGF